MLFSTLLLALPALALPQASGTVPSAATSPSATPTVHLPFVIKPLKRWQDLCLDVAAAQWRDGTPVQIYECNGSVAQVVMNGTTIAKGVPQKVDWPAGWTPSDWRPGDPWSGWCMDAGIDPKNGSKVKIWRCYPGLKQQTWVWDGLQWRIHGTNLCLDVTDGAFWSSTHLQVWECDKNNENQQWTYHATQW